MSTPIPINRAGFTLEAIAEVTGGALVSSGGLGPAGSVTGISTDTRALSSGAAFVALKGATFDGHDHLGAAAAAGAGAAIVERDVEPPPGLAVVRVSSTLAALGALAKAHTRAWRALGGTRTLIGITGSAGKTTTRVALSALLEQLRPGEIHATQGNLNNLIGAPMILLGLTPAHSFAVIELATNAPTEIAALAAIAEPDIGIITLIDAAHTEGLRSIEGVATEKSALFQALPRGGHAIGNADSEHVLRAIEATPAERRSTYSINAPSNARVVARSLEGLTSARITVTRSDPGQGDRSIELTTPLLGEAGALACAAAILAAESALGEPVSGSIATEAFAVADVGAGAGRLVPRVLPDGLMLIDDSYNANPASSCASIRAASEIARAASRRLILVLGEMRELGAESARGHERVGVAAGASGAAEVIAVGGDAIRIAEHAIFAGAGRATFAESADEAINAALRIVQEDDVVLIKGSRAIATEKVARALADAHGAAPRKKEER